MALPLRIATFNLESLDDRPGGGAALDERVAVLRPQLVRLRADVLCLQEVNGQREGPTAKRRGLIALDRLLADTPYAAYARAATASLSRGEPRDKHNLVILSRLPLLAHRQVRHDLVPPPAYRPVTALPPAEAPHAVEWDRPLLHAVIDLGAGRRLNVLNLHLKAPRAAFVEGQKRNAEAWRSMAGWAEGFFLAAVKRAGQALEARLLVEGLFDAEPNPLVAVCGDFNADARETPVRTIRGDEEDAGNPHLAHRTLVPLERSLPESQRFSVVHHGRPQMLDHILVSRPLLAWYRGAEIHNEALGDELVTAAAVRGGPDSYHAPVVAEFEVPDA
jgi:endonuclease/exonuclease/phosphatase family metal-dependent hydrolase